VSGMRILICDDEADYLDQLYVHINKYMQNHFIECDITVTQQPLSIIRSDAAFDIAFLDIQMEQIDGISLGKELKRRNNKLALFFVTNYCEYQDDAMDLQAFRYFEKPFDVNRLYAGLDKAMEYIDGAYIDVFLSGDGVQRRILVDNIMYVMRDNRRVVMVTNNGSFNVKESFEECCTKLPSLFFYKVHNSFFVNLHYVNEYSYSELLLSNGERISIASRRQASFRKAWFEYLRRR
jgi:two-component system, LytTR family, response regulator